jgi:hypothetical protein
MIYPLCQDSGVITLYQNGMPIRRPCRCLTAHRNLDRIQLTGRPGQPLYAQLYMCFAEVRSGGHANAIQPVGGSLRSYPTLSGRVLLTSQRPPSGLNLF